MKIYQAVRTEAGAVVCVNGRELQPRYDLRNHSPAGFEWGYGGSGPAQLALAILADFLGDDETAQILYQKFKRECIAPIAKERWTMSSQEIRDWLQRHGDALRN